MATSTQTSATRVVEGREVPLAGRWVLDPVHSQIQFVARHMMVSKVRGFFRNFSGMIVIADIPEESSLDVTMDAGSLDTGDPSRDEHLRSPEFLDVERYPELHYRSKRIQPGLGDKWVVIGFLTIRNVTRQVELSVEFCGAHGDPWGMVRAGFLATGEVDREDFDITWNQTLESGGFLVGRGVKIEIDAEAVLQTDDDGQADNNQ